MSTTVFLVLLGIGAVVFNWFVKSNPAAVAAMVRRLGGWLVLGIAVFVAMRGQLALAGPLLAVALYLLVRMGGLLPGSAPANKSQGQKSRVRTQTLSMELDHDTGAMDGEVLSGPCAGRMLSDLSLEELISLYRDSIDGDPQSSALLEAFLDRTHAEWREAAGAGSAGEQEHHAGSGGKMSREEALEILGLPQGASKQDIRSAHRALMKRFHPDHGGSSYLASKINQAKDLLLEK